MGCFTFYCILKITVKYRISGHTRCYAGAHGYVVINIKLIAFGSEGNPIFMALLLMYDTRARSVYGRRPLIYMAVKSKPVKKKKNVSVFSEIRAQYTMRLKKTVKIAYVVKDDCNESTNLPLCRLSQIEGGKN